MEAELILTLRWKSPLVDKLFHLYGNFLPQLSHRLGCEYYIEKVMDGVVIFYKTLADFVKFHQAADLISIPKSPPHSSPPNKNNEINMYVDAIRLPPNVTMEDLLPGVAKCYQIISKDITVERVSDSSAVIHYENAATFEAIFEHLKALWPQNKEDASQEYPKTKEVARSFDNLLP